MTICGELLLAGVAPIVVEIAEGAPLEIVRLDIGRMHSVVAGIDFCRIWPLEPDDLSSNRHPALVYCLSMIFSENRCPLFRIML
jgi:hypothetical protein